MTDVTDALPGLEPSTEPDAAGAPAAPPRPAAGYEIEHELRAALRAQRIAGVDEVGRGAWAGPVMVCAAVTDLSPPPELPGRGGHTIRLTDSKLLSAAHREAFADVLPGWLTAYAFGSSAPEEIDEVGMTEALRRAAVRALEALPEPPDAVILDGKHDYIGHTGGRRRWRARCEIKADQRSVTVAAASVLAKVHRDGFMTALDSRFPGYGFADSAGYPSPAHQKALAECGPTPHHRLSWSYLDDLPRWRHLKKHRDPLAGEGQMTLM